MRLLAKLVMAAALSLGALPAFAQDFIAGIPRNEALIIQGPTAQNADWFNLWVAGGGANVNGNQQLIDRRALVDQSGRWRRRLAECARHRATALQRRLHPDDGQAPRGRLLERWRRVHCRRRGLHRPDPDRSSRHGLERAIHRQRRQHRGPRPQHGRLQSQVAELTLPHALHRALERRLDPAQAHLREGRPTRSPSTTIRRSRSDPTCSTTTTRAATGRSGSCATTGSARRSAWTAGQPSVKYVVYRAAGNPDARVIEQRNHNLDVINDIAPEGMFSIMKDNATVAAWVEHFPFAHPDPTLPSILINHKVAPFENKDVRWALALPSTSAPLPLAPIAEQPISLRSACPRPGLPRPTITTRCSSGSPTSSSIPARSKIKPYNPNIATELAEMVRPTWGDAIPTDEAELKRVFGYGWWKQDAHRSGRTADQRPASPSRAIAG